MLSVRDLEGAPCRDRGKQQSEGRSAVKHCCLSGTRVRDWALALLRNLGSGIGGASVEQCYPVTYPVVPVTIPVTMPVTFPGVTVTHPGVTVTYSGVPVIHPEVPLNPLQGTSYLALL